MRRGVTLIELLVATGIFITGFGVLILLFTTGTAMRSKADTLVRTALASESLVEDLRLDARYDPLLNKPAASDYLGDGFAVNGPEDAAVLRPYRGSPGTWYVVEKAETPVSPSVLRLSILVMHRVDDRSELTLEELRRTSLRWTVPPELDQAQRAEWMREQLVLRGLATRVEARIIRQSTWQ